MIQPYISEESGDFPTIKFTFFSGPRQGWHMDSFYVPTLIYLKWLKKHCVEEDFERTSGLKGKSVITDCWCPPWVQIGDVTASISANPWVRHCHCKSLFFLRNIFWNNTSSLTLMVNYSYQQLVTTGDKVRFEEKQKIYGPSTLEIARRGYR